MEPYLFQGTVLPERAPLSLEFSVRFSHLSSGVHEWAKVSIRLNQVAVWVETEQEWDIFTLRNVVSNLVNHHLSMLGFLMGYAYDFSVTRVISRSRGVDWVFGIDAPFLFEDLGKRDIQAELLKLRDQTIGPNGIFLNRCFGDLVAALKYPDDTAFYCYRAIESLRHHCSAIHGLTAAGKAVQWGKFREVAGCDQDSIMKIKVASDGLRHGDPSLTQEYDRAAILRVTWGIVRSYLTEQ